MPVSPETIGVVVVSTAVAAAIVRSGYIPRLFRGHGSTEGVEAEAELSKNDVAKIARRGDVLGPDDRIEGP